MGNKSKQNKSQCIQPETQYIAPDKTCISKGFSSKSCLAKYMIHSIKYKCSEIVMN